MSASQDAQMASAFGYGTPAQQQNWAQRRQQRAGRVSVARAFMSSASEAMMHFTTRDIDAQLQAAHKVAMQQRFEESQTRTVERTKERSGRVIHERVSYSPTQDAKSLDSDLEFGD